MRDPEPRGVPTLREINRRHQLATWTLFCASAIALALLFISDVVLEAHPIDVRAAREALRALPLPVGATAAVLCIVGCATVGFFLPVLFGCRLGVPPVRAERALPGLSVEQAMAEIDGRLGRLGYSAAWAAPDVLAGEQSLAVVQPGGFMVEGFRKSKHSFALRVRPAPEGSAVLFEGRFLGGLRSDTGESDWLRGLADYLTLQAESFEPGPAYSPAAFAGVVTWTVGVGLLVALAAGVPPWPLIMHAAVLTNGAPAVFGGLALVRIASAPRELCGIDAAILSIVGAALSFAAAMTAILSLRLPAGI